MFTAVVATKAADAAATEVADTLQLSRPRVSAKRATHKLQVPTPTHTSPARMPLGRSQVSGHAYATHALSDFVQNTGNAHKI